MGSCASNPRAVAMVVLLALAAPHAEAAQAQAREVAEALALDPGALPRAEAGRWKGWKPSDAIPDEIRAPFDLALAAYREADFQLALAKLHEALARLPDHPAALYQCGTTYFRLRRYGDCAKVLERFLSVVPSEIGATQALGHSYYTLGAYERARDHYRLVLAANRDSTEAWRGLGLSHLRLGELEPALASLDEALERKPDHADAHTWRAQVLLDLGRGKDALAPARRGIELAPHEPKPWYVLAQVLGELGLDDEAEEARARFAELDRIEQDIRSQEGLLLHDPRALAPLERLVELHLATGNASEARRVLARAMRIAPERAELHALGLSAAVVAGDRAKADEIAETLRTRFAASAAAWRSLAAYYRATGDEAKAREALERARAGPVK